MAELPPEHREKLSAFMAAHRALHAGTIFIFTFTFTYDPYIGRLVRVRCSCGESETVD